MQPNWISLGRSWLTITACALSLMSGAALHAATAGARNYVTKPDEWFRSAEGTRVAENILSWQANAGDWPKNTDTTVPFTGERAKLQGTFDNSATTDELRFLARMIGAPAASPAATCSNAFTRGLTHILAAQYTNGGWPQYAPPPKSYHRHITFNDNSMVRLMIFLREVATEKRYEFVDAKQRTAAQRAFDRGVDCILKTHRVVRAA